MDSEQDNDCEMALAKRCQPLVAKPGCIYKICLCIAGRTDNDDDGVVVDDDEKNEGTASCDEHDEGGVGEGDYGDVENGDAKQLKKSEWTTHHGSRTF